MGSFSTWDKRLFSSENRGDRPNIPKKPPYGGPVIDLESGLPADAEDLVGLLPVGGLEGHRFARFSAKKGHAHRRLLADQVTARVGLDAGHDADLEVVL